MMTYFIIQMKLFNGDILLTHEWWEFAQLQASSILVNDQDKFRRHHWMKLGFE